jgi:hypothetical protein
MPQYYVATLARYVLVEAENADQARELGRLALHDLYADVRERLGRDVAVNIRTVRLATADEVELCTWHREMIASEAQMRQP